MFKKSDGFLKNILYLLAIGYIFLIGYLLIPFPFRRGFSIIIILITTTLFLLGLIVLFFARRERGRLKTFLAIVCFSTMAPPIFSILHNLFYQLMLNTKHFVYLFKALHEISFIIAVLVSPILFVLGEVGSLIILRSRPSLK